MVPKRPVPVPMYLCGLGPSCCAADKAIGGHMAKTYPEGTKLLQWFLAKEREKMIVRRHVILPDGKRSFERFPVNRYSHLTSKRDLEDFVIRLNGKDPAIERIKAKLSFKHAFISPDFMDDYRENYLFQQVPTQKDAQSMYGYLEHYALRFFIEQLGLKNPLEWHRHQNILGRYLLNKPDDTLEAEKLIFPNGTIKSAKLIRMTINELNRFMRYLHLKRPDEVPPLKFEPISRAAFKEHEARRKLLGEGRVSRYVKPEHYKKIVDALEEQKISWRFAVYLAHEYGLRRNETMGLQLEDLKKSHLFLQRQFTGNDKTGHPKYKPLKNRLPRRIPHWFTQPKQTYHLIEELSKGLIHPDTLSVSFSTLVADLKLPPYVFHDLRRTFITNAVKKGVTAEDLRLAVGHSSIETTYKYYVMDARELEDEIYLPDDAA